MRGDILWYFWQADHCIWVPVWVGEKIEGKGEKGVDKGVLGWYSNVDKGVLGWYSN